MTITGLKVFKFVSIVSTVTAIGFICVGLLTEISLGDFVRELSIISGNLILYPIISRHMELE
ncbi:hypothetical protein [Lacticaseibacillus brantae]|uniref:hypothetical protein n=1 Tax=Lacticaseibacillus brantae TaxID=943673 RepID=UPI00070A00D5|nr:hypothetical protein [Lacticaseibacillus brantae]